MSNVEEFCIIATIGFDEKLVLRALMKLGIKEKYRVLLIYSLSGGDYERGRVETAVKNLKEILRPLGLFIEDVIVPANNIVKDVEEILSKIQSLRPNRIVAILVGGMRLLLCEVLVSLSFYKTLIKPDVAVDLFLMREDGAYHIVLPLEVIVPPKITPREFHVLKEVCKRGGIIERSVLVEETSKLLKVSKSQVYKILESLVEKKVVEVKEDAVSLTSLGSLLCVILR